MPREAQQCHCGAIVQPPHLPPCPRCEAAERLATLPRGHVLEAVGVPTKYRHEPPHPEAYSKRGGVTPLDAKKVKLDLATGWKGQPPQVLLRGTVGVGKTMLAVELLYRCLLFDAARWMLSVLDNRRTEKLFFRASEIPSLAFADDKGAWNKLLRLPALLLDDLGRGYQGGAATPVGELIAHRFDAELPTIGTTNVQVEGELGDPAVISRFSAGIMATMTGRDRRGGV